MMKLEQIKKEMVKYKDFYGGELQNVDQIQGSRTKKELAKIIEGHRRFMDDVLSDANSHLDDFKKKIGVSY